MNACHMICTIVTLKLCARTPGADSDVNAAPGSKIHTPISHIELVENATRARTRFATTEELAASTALEIKFALAWEATTVQRAMSMEKF